MENLLKKGGCPCQRFLTAIGKNAHRVNIGPVSGEPEAPKTRKSKSRTVKTSEVSVLDRLGRAASTNMITIAVIGRNGVF